ncbi:MAG: DNA polymerase III subunit delta, partial [Oscillospiraceae bacterium]
MTITEIELKKELSLGRLANCYLLYGEERRILLSYRKRLEELLKAGDVECEIFDSKQVDFNAICENAATIPMLGGKRGFFCDDFDASLLSADTFEGFLTLLEDSENTNIIITYGEVPDFKKSARDRKLLAAAEKNGVAVNFTYHTERTLRDDVRNIVKKLKCQISAENAQILVERCGDDLGVLKGECEKLSAYCRDRGEIKEEDIIKVCSRNEKGDIFSLANLILNRKTEKVMQSVNLLLEDKVAAANIIANLGLAFYGFYSAASAKAAGKSYTEAAKELNEKFQWRMKNNF